MGMKWNKAKFTVKKIMCDGVGFIQVKPNVWRLYDGIRVLRVLTCDTKAVLEDFVKYNHAPYVRFTFWIPCSGWAEGGYENTQWEHNAVEVRAKVASWNRTRAKFNQEPITIRSIESLTREEFEAEF